MVDRECRKTRKVVRKDCKPKHGTGRLLTVKTRKDMLVHNDASKLHYNGCYVAETIPRCDLHVVKKLIQWFSLHDIKLQELITSLYIAWIPSTRFDNGFH